MIYFDNAVTSWPKPESVYEAVNKAQRRCGNPGRSGLQLRPLLYGGTGSRSESPEQPESGPGRYESGTHN